VGGEAQPQAGLSRNEQSLGEVCLVTDDAGHNQQLLVESAIGLDDCTPSPK
jgi:hypothetical protein